MSSRVDRAAAREGAGGRRSTRKAMLENIPWCLESCELSRLFQAFLREGRLSSGKTLRLKDGRLEISLLSQEHKGFSRVEPNTYSPSLLLLDGTPESSLGTNPTPSILLSPSLPSVVRVIFRSTRPFYNWLVPVRGAGFVSPWAWFLCTPDP